MFSFRICVSDGCKCWSNEIFDLAPARVLRCLTLPRKKMESNPSAHCRSRRQFGPVADQRTNLAFSCLASSFLVALITLAGLRIAHIVGGPNLVILYMLAVVFSALRWGRASALVSAVLSALLFDYFFVPPYRSVAVTDIWYSITLFASSL